MKNILFILALLISFSSYAQNEYNVLNTDKNVNVNVTNVDYGIQGVNYIGGGTYKYVQRALEESDSS